MRIVLDLQDLQVGAGRPTANGAGLALVDDILQQDGANEFVLALSGLRADSVRPLRARFADRLPADRIRVWRSPRPVAYADIANTHRRAAAELMREGFLASLQPDVVLVFLPTLGGYDDECVFSIGEFARDVPTAILLGADAFAVLLARDRGLRKDEWRTRVVTFLRRADMVLVESEAQRAQAIELGIDESRIRVQHEPHDRSGETSGRITLRRLEDLVQRSQKPELDLDVLQKVRPKLAFLSPLPPQRSGISDYSVSLLPELARYYDIEVISAQADVAVSWVRANAPVRSLEWFLANAARYERVLYHFGNSSFHQHMFHLIRQVPGVVVLHDFYLGHAVAGVPTHQGPHDYWTDALYRSHGYLAVRDRLVQEEDALWKYPANLPVLTNGQGVIVHSASLRSLAGGWYGPELARDWAHVPLLRTAVNQSVSTRQRARSELGLSESDFVVCSFGMVGPAKASGRLLAAWMGSALARDPHCVLFFVGEHHADDWGKQFAQQVKAAGAQCRVHLTGWTDADVYRRYLEAADAAVQLRTQSRGETSAAVLDCLNHGIATIVNAHGTMVDLPPDTVLMLPDVFDDSQLVAALENVRGDAPLRKRTGASGRQLIRTEHSPRHCGAAYACAIEEFHERSHNGRTRFLRSMMELAGNPRSDVDAGELAADIDYSMAEPSPLRHLFVDVSAIVHTDLRTGIQRVVRSTLKAMLDAPPPGFRIEPVYMSDAGGVWRWRYARQYTLGLLDCPRTDCLQDEVVEPLAGDVFLGLDLAGIYLVRSEEDAGLLRQWRDKGVRVHFVVYDMLPILMPEKFPAESAAVHRRWLDIVTGFDGAVCISRSVADELREWMRAKHPEREPAFAIGFFHLGADIQNSSPTRGMPEQFEGMLDRIVSRPSFLMVGTVEPRKGHAQVLAGFEQLWSEGVECNLVIVGKTGWGMDQFTARLASHPELGRRLLWLQAVSDECLNKLYSVCASLIAASEGEGFGLPLIEAAQHRLPVIARSLPVFREVAGSHAHYFEGMDAAAIATSVKSWLDLRAAGAEPRSEGMPHLTWQESTVALLHALQLVQPCLERPASTGRVRPKNELVGPAVALVDAGAQ